MVAAELSKIAIPAFHSPYQTLVAATAMFVSSCGDIHPDRATVTIDRKRGVETNRGVWLPIAWF
jgi:hypothetical protein